MWEIKKTQTKNESKYLSNHIHIISINIKDQKNGKPNISYLQRIGMTFLVYFKPNRARSADS